MLLFNKLKLALFSLVVLGIVLPLLWFILGMVAAFYWFFIQVGFKLVGSWV